MLEEEHGYRKYSMALLEEIEKLDKNIEKHRERNFIGSILSYSKNHNTKYFSKWLEEKSKRQVLSNTDGHQ